METSFILLSVIAGSSVLSFMLHLRGRNQQTRAEHLQMEITRLTTEVSTKDKQISSLEGWRTRIQQKVSDRPLIKHQFVDVVLFGPRASGKTSLVELWTSPWTQISQIDPTSRWNKYEVDLHEFTPVQKPDPLYEVDRKYIPVLRMRVRDYPGEESYRNQAIEYIRDMGERAVIVFLFKVGPYQNGEIQEQDANGLYYSYAFIEQIFQHIPRVASKISRVVVVFNRADLLPAQWTWEESLNHLKEANRAPLHHIERLFDGMMEYHLTSAKTNQGVVRLLGIIGTAGLHEKQVQEYEQALEATKQEFVVHHPSEVYPQH